MLALEADEPPPYDTELTLDGKAVGRVTSSARDPEHGVVALAYVRREVPADAVLDWPAGPRASSRSACRPHQAGQTQRLDCASPRP